MCILLLHCYRLGKISHHYCRSKWRGQRRPPWQKGQWWVRSIFLRQKKNSFKTLTLLFGLNPYSWLLLYMNFNIHISGHKKRIAHLWRREFSSRFVSSIFLQQPPGSPPSRTCSPQQLLILSFPGPLLQPGKRWLVLHI